MRTTIRLDDQLLRDAKALAARTGRTLTDIIEESLRRSLAVAEGAGPPPAELPIFEGRGPQPGVDLDNSASLLDLMDRHAAD